MIPQNLRYGGGVSSSVFNPVVLAILIVACVLICLLPRKKVIIPFLCAAILIPFNQVLVLGGLHFPLLRILILVGLLRTLVLGSGKTFSGGFNTLDKIIISLSLTTFVAGILLFRREQAVVFEAGALITSLGLYLVLRCLIRDQEDVLRAIRAFAFIMVVLTGVMTVEHLTRGWNPYTLVGGVRADARDMIRRGHVRATASFGQPIPAGTFGGVAVPLFVALWMADDKHHLTAKIGLLAAVAVAVLSGSSTPVFACATGIGALFLWPMRSSMRLVRWGIVFMLICMQAVMTSPVYHIITHLHAGDSYHRFELIHQTVLHFSSWCLIGTNNNASWGWDMWDTADQYVATAISGGLLGLILLLSALVFAFKYLGKARRAVSANKNQALFFWALGSALFAELVAFFGISLWDQSIVEWYLLLAFVGAVAAPLARAKTQVAASNLSPSAPVAEIQPVYAGWRARTDGRKPLGERGASLRGASAFRERA